jgi:hypothetical protein
MRCRLPCSVPSASAAPPPADEGQSRSRAGSRPFRVKRRPERKCRYWRCVPQPRSEAAAPPSSLWGRSSGAATTIRGAQARNSQAGRYQEKTSTRAAMPARPGRSGNLPDERSPISRGGKMARILRRNFFTDARARIHGFAARMWRITSGQTVP